jgi:general secretion pathway protein G
MHRAAAASKRPRLQEDGAAGFTLIELLVVLAILGLIAAVATPQLLKYLGKSKTDAAKLEIKNLSLALDLFRLDVGRYPAEQEGIGSIVQKPPGLALWGGPYLKVKELPRDPWGRPYVYRFPGQHADFDLFTFGADNLPGGSGENQDVVSW